MQYMYTICTTLFQGGQRCLHSSLDLKDNIDLHTVLAVYNNVFRQAAGIFCRLSEYFFIEYCF